MNSNQWIATISYPVSITVGMIEQHNIPIKTFLSMNRDAQREVLLEIAEYYFSNSSIKPYIQDRSSLLNNY
jgi:hypothetical protein